MNFMGRGEGSGCGTTKSYMLVWKFRTTTFWLAPFLYLVCCFLWEKRSKLEVSKEGKGARVEVGWMFGREYLRLELSGIPDGCSILSAIHILRGMYMKCHFYVRRHLNLLGMFSIWCSCCKFCNNCWDLFLNLSECLTSWTLQKLPLLICPISYFRHKCKNCICTFTLLFAITYSPTR